MPNPVLSAFVARVRRAALARTPDKAPTDGQLLTRFIASRDEEAFAALVSRYGPMVLAVCRRVARDSHLADDAFQAAFLVLARRAADVKPREAVRAWLYGVAVRTAREARATSARRRSREVPMPQVPDRPTSDESPADADALSALDEEIARLPNHLRAAVVLCEIDGVRRRDAAARLGLPEGTLSSRLAKARKLLADRLRDRGLAPMAAGLTALSGHAAAGVRAALADATVRLAGSAPVSAAVAELSRGVFRSMLLNKLKLLTVGLTLAVVVTWVSAGVVLRYSRAQQPPEKPAAQPTAPKPAGPGRILYSQDGTLYVTDPAGKNERRIDLPPGAGGTAVPSPDVRSLAYWTQTENDPGRAVLCLRALDGQGNEARFKLPEKIGFVLYCWSPDGTEVHVNTGTPGLTGVQHLRVDVKARKMTPLNVLKTHLVTDYSRDGKYFLTTEVGNGAEWQPKSLHLMNRDGTEHLALTGPRDMAMGGRLSPDGKRVLCLNEGRLSVLDVGKPESLTPVQGIPEKAEVVGLAWSPDGKRIAYTIGTSRFLEPEELKKLESRLVIADPDGKNAKVLRSVKGELIMEVHWR